MLGPHDDLIGCADQDSRGSPELARHLRIDVEVGQLARAAFEASRLHAIPRLPDAQLVPGNWRHQHVGSGRCGGVVIATKIEHVGAAFGESEAGLPLPDRIAGDF